MRRAYALLAARPSLLIMLGLAVGQGLVYLATPFVAKIYTPAQVGGAGVFVAVTGALGSVGILRLDQRVAACEERELPSIIRTAMSIGLVSSVVGAALWLWLRGGGLWVGVCFALVSLGFGMTPLVSQLASRERAFAPLAGSRAAAGAAQATSHVSLGLAGLTQVGLYAGYAIGYGAGVLVLAKRLVTPLRHGVVDGTRRWISRVTFRTSAAISLATIVNSLVVAAIPLLLATFYDDATVGRFAIAQRIAVVPAALVVAAVAPVVAADVGEKLRVTSPVRPIIRGHLRRWAPVGLLVLVVPWLVPASMITGLLGQEWEQVTYFMRVLSPMLASQVAIGPVSQVLMLAGKARTQLYWDLSRFALVLLAAVTVAGLGASPVLMTATIAMSSTLFYLVLARLVLQIDD